MSAQTEPAEPGSEVARPASKLLRRTALAFLTSILAHFGLLFGLGLATTLPDVGLDFEMPMEVEIGLTEAVTVRSGEELARQAPQRAAQAPQTDPVDPGGDPALAADAGVPEADAGPPGDAGPLVASAAAGTSARRGQPGGTGQGVAFLPAGSQIALRLDLGRIRRSPVAPEVRRVLAAIPDWQALLGASGIDPLDDLDRLLIATPNLERSRIVLAGRVRGPNDRRIRQAVAAMARAVGSSGQAAAPAWRVEEGVELCDWPSGDGVPRVLAIVGPRHFVLARREDLPRILAVAYARAADPEGEGAAASQADAGAPAAPREHPADALLSMGFREGLSLEVEGARGFAQARGRGEVPVEVVPTRFRLALREERDRGVRARAQGRYESAAEAEAARRHWDRVRTAFAGNPAVAFMGFSGPLRDGRITTQGRTMRVETQISEDQTRVLLGLVEGAVRDYARRRRLAEQEAQRAAQQEAQQEAQGAEPDPEEPPAEDPSEDEPSSEDEP